MKFDCKISDCDVKDMESLRKYRGKLVEWHELLKGDLVHSIYRQIHGMIWLDAAFRVLNEARKDNCEKDYCSKNILISNLLDIGYINTQVISISKLIEKNSKNDKSKGVVSLHRLLEDVQSQRCLITRENFVCYDGLPFDWRAEEQREQRQMRSVDGTVFAWGTSRSSMSKDRHELFNRICHLNSSGCRSDIVSNDMFEYLLDLLIHDNVKKLKMFRDKVIAHAADPFSRRDFDDVEGVSMSQISDIHHKLYIVYHNLNLLLFSENIGNPVPDTVYDPLEHLEHPFVDKVEIAKLRVVWSAHAEERRAWAAEQFFVRN